MAYLIVHTNFITARRIRLIYINTLLDSVTLGRHFRLPIILVGDGRLGGISGTLSAYETLLLRGYDVSAVVLEDCGSSNDKFLLSYLRNR